MKICGIIAEYNPFHNGHKAMIDEIRLKNPDCAIVVILGSNFTQRGDISIVSKYVRAEMALSCGADLVLGLPVTTTLSNAESFAAGSISLLNSLNVIDELYFGSEAGKIEELNKCRRCMNDVRVEEHIKYNLSSGKTYAKVRQDGVRRYFGDEMANMLAYPNNILGFEYIKALEKSSSEILPRTIKRVGNEHDGEPKGNYASASYIRNNIKDSMFFVPDNVRIILERESIEGHCPAKIQNIENALLALLRTTTPSQIKFLPDLSEGIEHRITDAIINSRSLNELYENTKTKRYTMARIKRLFLYTALRITKDDTDTLPQYIHALGATEKGIAVLSEISKKATLPVVTKYSDFGMLKGKAKRQLEIECDATNLYSLAFENPFPCGTEITYKFIKK